VSQADYLWNTPNHPEDQPPATSIQPFRAPHNFVAPAPLAAVQAAPPVDPYTIQAVPSAFVEARTYGSYQDRAKGFQIVSVPIAVCFGVGMGVVALLGFQVPVFSIGMLAVFWLAFLAWWLAAWALHLLFSADGVALFQAWGMFRILRQEQKERHKRYHIGGRQ